MKKSMKWLAVVLCVALVAVTLVSCGGSKNPAETTAGETSESVAQEESKKPEAGKTYTIGICQQVQHPALDAATKGFQEKLTELLGKDNVKFQVQNGSDDANICSTIANQFAASKVDLIMANATKALQSCAAATDKIPVVGTSVTEYGVALEIKDFNGKTGTNVTGVSDLAPLDKQAAMFAELLPEAKTIGLLYCSAEANSKYQVEVVKAELEKAGLTVKEYSFADSNDISSVVTKAVSDCDALYVPTDNSAANNTELINNIAEPAKCPIIAGEEGICKGCGIATLSISYYDLGVATAEMAYEILVNGANPGDTEIAYTKDFTPKYVKSRTDAFGISIPDTYTAIEE